jgi:hypothetical protein
MKPRRLLSLAALVAVLLAASPAAWAQIYRWTDDQGRTYYSDGLESVPSRYRSTAVPVGYNTPSRPAPANPSADPTAPAAAAGPTKISFTPGQPIMVTARINDGGSVRLQLDTGASITTINPSTLSALGISFRNAQRGSIKGVTGEANVLAVQVQSIDVSGARFGPLLVVAHDAGLGSAQDGLLGRDFLDHFTVTIDNTAGVVTLTPKQ